MDPFTQRMLERTRLRREKLDQHISKDIGLRYPPIQKNSCDGVDSFDKNENITKSDYTSLKAVHVDSVCDSENKVTYKRKEQSGITEEYSENAKNDCGSGYRSKTNQLAALAQKIREWEDELDKPKQTSSSGEKTKLCDQKKVTQPSEKVKKFSQPTCEEKKTEKQVIWDRTILKSLECQGYELSKNESRLIYDFEHNKGNTSPKSEPAFQLSGTKMASSPCKRVGPDTSKKDSAMKETDENRPQINEDKCSVVFKKAAFFESQNKSSPVKMQEDLSELPFSERIAIFEKNVGDIFYRKVAHPTRLRPKLANKPANKISADKFKYEISNGRNRLNKRINADSDKSEAQVKVPIKTLEGMETENKVKAQKEKFEKVLTMNVNEPTRNADIVSREKELEYLKTRWDRYKNVSEKEQPKIPEPPPMPSVCITTPPRTPVAPKPDYALSPPKTADTEEKFEISKNNSGRLYPSLSDFDESDDSDRPESGSDSHNGSKNSNMYLNMSFSDILQAKKNDPLSSNEHSFNAELRESQVLSKMDEFLDNALKDISFTEDYESDENDPSPPKLMRSSSFEYKNNSEDANPLVHTVSFYRKQQQVSVNNQTPNSVKSVKREEKITENARVEPEEILVENKIQELLQEINKQQTVISQASQALNLCLSTVEFSNSGEQVESERLLLLANHKRQACLNEIQRLKVENSIRPRGSNYQLTERGDLIISNISVPLKRDAVRAMAAVESMQYVVCLIKCEERVIATPTVPATRENLKNTVLCIPGRYKLEKLFSDFKVTIEVYHLELNKEMLPHEVKYHIVNKKENKLLTPIKSKKTESKLVMPCVQSPAGPNAVRSSNFHLGGYLVFSLREVTRTNWTLNKVPYTSPLEGCFSMNIESQLQLDTEFRGFLTMFDDISGFGAWHRRWCLLSSHTLSYWKYPDDETRKIPIGTIDLRGVVTEDVGLVSRDICARLHTFLLETTRQRQEDDKESLVLNIQGDITRIRHLLSADSKEEMLTWCRKLNTTLALLRSWRCNLEAS